MKRLIEGLTRTQFLAILNENLIELATIRNVSPYDTLTTSTDYTTALNVAFGNTEVAFGQEGLAFKTSIDNAFIDKAGGIVDPVVTWVEDYAKIDIEGTNPVQYDIYESKNGGAYSLLTTLNSDVKTYNNTTWQNATMSYKIKEHGGSIYSGMVNYSTPLVFKTNQNTPGVFTIHQLKMTTVGKSVTVHWGDGTTTNYNSVEWEYNIVTHTYTIPQNPYYIQIFGDTDDLGCIEMFGLAGIVYGDLTKWILPSKLEDFHFYSNTFTGDVSEWILPVQISLFDIENNAFTGDITNWFESFPSTMTDFHCGGNNNLIGDLTNMTFPNSMFLFQLMQQKLTGNITNWNFNNGSLAFLDLRQVSNISGDISSWVIPQGLAVLLLTDIIYQTPNLSIIGDLSNWVFPTSMYPTLGYTWDFWGMVGITGDLSSKIIPVGHPVGTSKRIDFTNCGITKLPYGSFADIDLYTFGGCKCNSAEIDRILGVIDSYFIGGVVPLVNCVYTLNGTGMGIPSAAGLISRSSIIAKYVAQGKTCSIVVNS